ncbi:hypothetical protein M5K25_019074 [Dendrobium thyrsiflorum]|uniref:5'-nucleotidase n=1 Tax=Dendrobium thyrsiflorum TaxID=117978 RepID=A0ABD0UDT8_DENTH
MKKHLSGSHKNVAPCVNVPDNVKEEITACIKKSTTTKYLQQEQFDDRVEQGAYYGSESGNDFSSTIHSRGARGLMDQYMINPGEDRGKAQMMPVAGKTIHVLNKNEHALDMAVPVHDQRGDLNGLKNESNSVKKRTNVLLLGDHIGDLGMSDGLNYENRIAAGFL